jgi:hypothetical protein
VPPDERKPPPPGHAMWSVEEGGPRDGRRYEVAATFSTKTDFDFTLLPRRK